MIFTKREEDLLKAFLKMGKLSIHEISDLLAISQRTSYRLIADLDQSLESLDIYLLKDKRKYYLSGDLSQLASISSMTGYNRSERLNFICLDLLLAQTPLTNEELQERFQVSNVTIIQDIAIIDKRLSELGAKIERKQGYQLILEVALRRRLLTILLCQTDSLSLKRLDYLAQKSPEIATDLEISQAVFKDLESSQDVTKIDPKLRQFFMTLLALSGHFGQAAIQQPQHQLSKQALEFTQQLYRQYVEKNKKIYAINELLFYASTLDELLIKRQDNPLYIESFDSPFFYMVSNLIDKVSLYTKINFVNDTTLFKFLFHHVRLSLAIPVLFPDESVSQISRLAAHKDEYLHQVICLVMQDLFPPYLQNEAEYELVTLHFASSICRSPDIYPLRLLLISNQRPLTIDLLISKIKTCAPFVQSVQVKSIEDYTADDHENFDYILSTNPIANATIDLISTFPSTAEILRLQETLQDIQSRRQHHMVSHIRHFDNTDLEQYLTASQELLQNFYIKSLDNHLSFENTVAELLDDITGITDKDYLVQKLIHRFHESPLAIPETGLALLHTQSHTVTNSLFAIYELAQPLVLTSMNHTQETVRRILVMLTPLTATEGLRRLMTTISQSLIENHLYTEIYKTGNHDITYQLLNKIFTESIKNLENDSWNFKNNSLN